MKSNTQQIASLPSYVKVLETSGHWDTMAQQWSEKSQTIEEENILIII